jgi:hypothetical protein
MLKISQFTLTLLATATLVACGGGGSSSSRVTPQPAALATAAYGGNWKDACSIQGSLFKNSSNTNLNEQYFSTITPISDTSISVVDTIKHFAPTDTTCSGSPVIVQTQAGLTLTLTGTATIGAQVVDKITFPGQAATTNLTSGSISLSGASLNANTVSINGYSISGAWLAGDTTPGKILLRATANAIYCGDNSTNSPVTGFPTAMEAGACLTKI